jgi:phenylpropionate dioxygenase-like ring-hydroxylating dioxygenase large terminal subunit
MEQLWPRTWVYVGHDSQIPEQGDYITTQIGSEPVIMVRHKDDSVQVLRNRCAHKGAKLVSDAQGSVRKFFRCPYHAWTYRTDGSLLAVPLHGAYDRPVWDLPSSLANRCPPSTTWRTARRRAKWQLPAACCATCTTATGRCSSRTSMI